MLPGIILQISNMNTDQSIALKALIHLREILANTSPDLIRSLCEADEIRLALDQIFKNQGKEVNNKRSRPAYEDHNPSKFLRTFQCSSSVIQSPRHEGEIDSSHTSSSSTRSSQKILLPSAKSPFPSLEKAMLSVPSTITKRILPSPIPSAPSPPLNVGTLISALDTSFERITKALTNENPEAAATFQAEWKYEDPRVVDIKISSASIYKETAKVRRTFAERGLAGEYIGWRLFHHRSDTIEELMHNPRARSKEGTVENFIERHSEQFKDTRTVRDGLNHGVKMLLLERMFGKPVISAILNFRHRDFVKVRRDELYALCKAVQDSKKIMALVEKLPGWLEKCQAKYDGKQIFTIVEVSSSLLIG